uniref:Putative secreted protein n=1 Tax=Ixodes ricinus TaxID=34613 RepID=A0A6B0URV7_IXORI
MHVGVCPGRWSRAVSPSAVLCVAFCPSSSPGTSSQCISVGERWSQTAGRLSDPAARVVLRECRLGDVSVEGSALAAIGCRCTPTNQLSRLFPPDLEHFIYAHNVCIWASAFSIDTVETLLQNGLDIIVSFLKIA